VSDELRKCTDCGLCLSSCPTFTASRAEGDSPRGRVHLIEFALAGAAPGPVSDAYLSGCIECGACHDPCPTGVRVAVARRAHRLTAEAVDWAGFEHRAAELSLMIDEDAGARVTIDAVGDLRPVVPGGAARKAGRDEGVLPLAGPLLRSAAPHLVADLEHRLSGVPGVVTDPALAAALERASGLLGDVGLGADQERAAAAAVDLVAARDYRLLTVAALDWLALRLRDMELPEAVRVVPAYQVFAMPVPLAGAIVWDHPGETPAGLPPCDVLPAAHAPAGAPVLLSGPALRAIGDLVKAKQRWLAARTLLTMDARSVARFPEARHIAQFLVPSNIAMGGT
jgi:ferredoxin